ncbi:MAG: hypothetical protein MPW14_25810 (plasmid) [Candidatus Manganitrophus sp.]|nr:MAG: hypothetical protein MPW14_25810 [Candidatus Manganitrophus sp.]
MRRIVLWNITLLAGLIAILSAKVAFASCGSANCFLVTGTQEGITTPGQIVIDLSYRWVPMDQIQRGTDSDSEALVPAIDFENGVIAPDSHSEIRTNNELFQLDLGFGVTERFTLTASLPFSTFAPTNIPMTGASSAGRTGPPASVISV